MPANADYDKRVENPCMSREQAAGALVAELATSSSPFAGAFALSRDSRLGASRECA